MFYCIIANVHKAGQCSNQAQTVGFTHFYLLPE